MDIMGAFQVSFAQLIGPSAIFYALLAIGLNLHFGYAGLLNFGQIGFALLGGYGVGLRGVTTGEDDVGPGFAQRSCDYLTQSAVRPRDDKCAAGLIDYVFCGPFGHAFQRTCLTRR